MTRALVGVVGTGQMGMPMVERLLASGHDVAVRARRAEAAARATSLGARVVDDLGGFADRDVVIVCVYTDEQVREVGPPVLAAMAAGATVIVHTTGSPTTVGHLATRAAGTGVRVLDAALSGGPADVGAGRLTLLVGGDAAVLDDVRPVLQAYADPILHVGTLGDGMRVKLVNNALFGAQAALVAEAERVAAALGVDPHAALEAVQHCSGDSRVLRTVLAVGSSAQLEQLAGRFIRKDIAVTEDVARELGVDLGRLGTDRHRLADREEIKELKARYFRFIDTKDWASFRELFTDDCKHWLPQGSPVPFMTNDDYFPMMESMLSPGVTTHQGSMPEITFTGADEAEGIWAMFDYVQSDAPSGRVSIMGWGHYLETYRRGPDGRWRISSKRNERLRVDEVPWTLPDGGS
jgi:3-hydroxyisobutyrate dehydrogenase-like beta-hydroxyacid dehydrogenase